MLAARLARGSGPLVLLRRTLVAAASAGAGFLLLCTLGRAMSNPAGSPLRLLWCLIPVAATVQFAIAVARADPATKPRQALSAAGFGAGRMARLAALSTGVSCTFGSAVALLLFLRLRGDLAGTPFEGRGADLLAAGQPLPLPAALTLLAIVPVLATLFVALALRPRRPARAAKGEVRPEPRRPDGFAPTPAPAGLPWGVALTAAGLAVETYASRGGSGSPVRLPGAFDGNPAGVLIGWALTALGLALAGPGLTHLSGRMLQSLRPGAIRLLAGRSLMNEARRIGAPLGVLCAVVSGVPAATALHGPGDDGPFGPLTGMGAALIVGCTAATLLTAALESKQERSGTRASLLRIGTPAGALRTAVLVRAGALAALFVPLTWALSSLAAVPLAH